MKKLARILRKAGFILIMIIAAFAVGVTGQFLPTTHERYRNKRNTTEQIDKKRKED